MTKMNLLVVALTATAAFAAMPARGADLAAGKAKAQEVCQACHGMDGQSAANPEYPKLAGQYPDYLAKALRGYKAGTRKNAIMAGMAAALSDKDIENLSAYFASQPGVLTTRY
jgi:cytochrome c553